MRKEDILVDKSGREAQCVGTVKLPAGTFWFLVQNPTDKEIDMHLECFDVLK